jgi:crotonobetainyl-CoA:carnitine CoA-transferase CaiB-like acyl-CoA transferase
MDMPAAPLPLDGVRVVEVCNVAAGPFCGMLLADMGAQVTKIEPPGGDMLRHWPPHADGFSENFASLNRGKRSIALDLRAPADLAIATELVLGADVVLENNRPGVMDRLGLGYDRLRGQRPSLIYCSISAYGHVGPRAEQGGFDVTLQAASGIMSVTGEPGGMPVKCGVPVADFTAGLYGAYAICAAMLTVRQTGAGTRIDVPMLGTSLAIAALQTSEHFGTGADPQALGSAHPRNAPYQAFRAEDRAFVIAAGNDSLWRRVCQALGDPALADTPSFATVALRARNQVELATLLNARFASQSAAYWVGALDALGVPVSLINSYSEALADPQVEAAGWVVPMTLPNGARTRTFISPLRLDGRTLPVRAGPPALDGDRAEILAELGATRQEVSHD